MANLNVYRKELSELPGLPRNVMRLVNALNGDEMDWNETERLVRTDEAIATAVLRMANSAALGQPGRTFNLKESIGRLGAQSLQKIALSMGCSELLADGGQGYGLLRGDMWRNAVCGAVAAELIAKRTGLEDSGICFVAGLIRDIGKLAMSRLFDVAELEAVFKSNRDDLDQVSLERKVFGHDHAELGYALATLWRLPDALATAVRYHHAPPDDDPRNNLCDIVHCADALCSLLCVGAGYDGMSYRISAHSAESIGMDCNAVEYYLAEIHVQTEQLEASLE